MTNVIKSAHFTPRVKKLYNRLKKEGGRVAIEYVDDPMEMLLRGIIGNYTSDNRAAAAVTKLRAALVDLNELRVTSPSEIVEIIGADIRGARHAAEEIVRALGAIFNRRHNLNLDFLRTGTRKNAETFLAALDGVTPHAVAVVIAFCLRGHAVPVDQNMHACLIKEKCIPPEAEIEEVQRFLANQFKGDDAPKFYLLMKKYSVVHAPRRGGKTPEGEASAAATESDPAATAPAEPAKQSAATRGQETHKTRPAARSPSALKQQAAGGKVKRRALVAVAKPASAKKPAAGKKSSKQG